MKNKVIPNPKNRHEMNIMAFKYHLGHDIRIEVNMGKEKILNQITAQDKVVSAHKFLIDFLNKFDTAKRGGIHDFMELTLFNMVNSAIKNIDDYLQSGHTQVDATQVMHIVADSYQKVLDGIKRNLEGMEGVNFR